MSKKDYQAIARELHRLSGPDPTGHTVTSIEYHAHLWLRADHVREALAGVFAADSHRFDRARFREACETGTTRGMRKLKPEQDGRAYNPEPEVS